MGETSDGAGNAQGSYSVALPDGRIQRVTYTANGYDGYVADVTYEGTAVYPEAPVVKAAPAHAAPVVHAVAHPVVHAVAHPVAHAVAHPVAHAVGFNDLAEISPYTYQYGVNDDYSGAAFQQTESDDGTGVRDGSYSVNLPDGRIQHVNYHANDATGYIAEVTYDGTASSPDVVGVAHPVAHAVARPVAHPAALVGHGVVGHGLAGHGAVV